MLKKLRIQNFKVWEDTGEIDLAPITLFFGANSSGKSSIGQFLMMLKQTVESRGETCFILVIEIRQFNWDPTKKWSFSAM